MEEISVTGPKEPKLMAVRSNFSKNVLFVPTVTSKSWSDITMLVFMYTEVRIFICGSKLRSINKSLGMFRLMYPVKGIGF